MPGRKPLPRRKPRNGYRWELCPTCNGTGHVIGRFVMQPAGRKTRCGRCLREGWIEVPIRRSSKKSIEGAIERTEQESHPTESVRESLKKPTAEEQVEEPRQDLRSDQASQPVNKPSKPSAGPPKEEERNKKNRREKRRPIWADLPSQHPASDTRDKSERDIHGANCDCKWCISLRKGYARARSRRRLKWSNNAFAAAILLLIVGGILGFFLGAFDGFLDEGDNSNTAINGPNPSPTQLIPNATVRSTPAAVHTPNPTERPYSDSMAETNRGIIPVPVVSHLPTPSPTPMAMSTHTPTPVPIPSPTLPPIRRATPFPTLTAVPAPTQPPIIAPTPTPPPVPTPTPEPTSIVPHLRHLDEKQYMLELINEERTKAGLSPVGFGDNPAAQLHAEDMLENCFSSHWGSDGLKPYMRYGLAGGYQSNSENVLGLDYCVESSDNYRPIQSIGQEIKDAMEEWMNSPGHSRNILRSWHRKVNIGIAWDRYNFKAVQHFEGDRFVYERLPEITDGTLRIEGTIDNGVPIESDEDIVVQIFYDPLPQRLTLGQLSRTYCYSYGKQIASLRPPLAGGWYYDEDHFETLPKVPCQDPHEIPAGAPAPRSPSEALKFWLRALEAHVVNLTLGSPVTVPWITATEWTLSGITFSVTADIGHILDKYGDGVYSVVIWAPLDGEDTIVSEYSLFLEDS